MTPASLAGPLAQLRRPLGVFDSGVGGLTVLGALRAAMPERDFVYLADTARVPYGRKPREMVAGFARAIADFLVDLGVEGVVVACNTAAAAAPDLTLSVPVWNVIGPGVEAARRRTQGGRVGVIATRGTVASGAYQDRLAALGLNVWAAACPMFVPLVEEGLADSAEARALAALYLAGRPDLDTLILGCTHYPVLRGVIAAAVGPGVQLVDSAEVTAETVRAGTAPAGGGGRALHLVTGDTAAYQHTASLLGVRFAPELGAGPDTWSDQVVHLDVLALSYGAPHAAR